MKKGKGKPKLRIKPIKYTLMELRHINYCKRKGIPIPQELLDKKFEDFTIDDKQKVPKPQMLNLKEDNESSHSKENNQSENNQSSQRNKLLVVNDVQKVSASAEPEKVSLIKIGVAPKLGGDANNANANKQPSNGDVMTIQVSKGNSKPK